MSALTGHSFATQYFTISRLPCSAASVIVPSFHLHLFSSRAHLEQLEFIRPSAPEQKFVSVQPTHHNDLFSHTNSNVDIEDISLILNLFFKSPARDDLLIKSLVSVFTSYKDSEIGPIQSRKRYLETKYRRYSQSRPTKNLSPQSVFSALASSLQT